MKRVFEYYGLREELTDLIYELQWPQMDKGSSLADLARSLKKRGVHVCAARIPPSLAIYWQNPVIVHFSGRR